MRMPFLIRVGMYALVAAGFAGGAGLSVYAAGGEGAPAKKPVPDIEKKVYTNDDLEAKYGKRTAASESKNAEAIATAERTAPAAQPSRTAVRREPIAPEKDPRWYAQQTVGLNGEIAAIDADLAPLTAFRRRGETSRADIGLNVVAPCVGITTDNRIAQLLAQRAEVEAKIEDLEDTARQNGVPPGTFVRADEITEASAQAPQLSAAQQREKLLDQLGQLSDRLADNEVEVQGMQAEMDARRMTLLRANGSGGNMTTNLLSNISADSNALRAQIGSLEDAALNAGIPARDLP